MNILFIIPNLNRSGAERMVVNICNELVKDDKNKIAIYLIENSNDFLSELDKRVKVDGGEISFHLSIYKKNRIQNSRYIEFVNEFKPDVIHSHLYIGDMLAHSYHYKNSIYISHLHNSKIEEYNGFDRSRISDKRMWTNLYEYNWLRNRYKRYQTKFIACSAGAGKLHQEKIRAGKMVILPNASPLPSITKTNKKINEPINLIWIGRLTDVKRPQIVIQIAALLKEKGIEFNLKIAGDGPEMSNCKKLIGELSLHNNVEMIGSVQDLEPLYQAAHLMIHTSVFEGLPMVFVEATSNGIPIVSTDCMPGNELIEDGVNGRIIHSVNPADFVAVIVDVINSPDLYANLSQNALAISKKFGIKNYVENILSFYRS